MSRARTLEDFEAHFWKRVDRSGECWEWTGFRASNGYGQLQRHGVVLYTHRVAWTLTSGDPGENCVLHHCDNPPCCRPDHLFLGDRGDNIRDCTAKVRGNGRIDSPVKKLTADQVREIRAIYAEGRTSQHALARQFGVAQMTISKIVRRETWAYL